MGCLLVFFGFCSFDLIFVGLRMFGCFVEYFGLMLLIVFIWVVWVCFVMLQFRVVRLSVCCLDYLCCLLYDCYLAIFVGFVLSLLAVCKCIAF